MPSSSARVAPSRSSCLARAAGRGSPSETTESGWSPSASRTSSSGSSAGSRRQYGGLGLGLYIVRSIVDSMGGDVRFEATPGGGSTFDVTLPYGLDAAADRDPGSRDGG